VRANGTDFVCGIEMVVCIVVLLFLSTIIVTILLSNFSSNDMASSAKLEIPCMLRESQHDRHNDGQAGIFANT